MGNTTSQQESSPKSSENNNNNDSDAIQSLTFKSIDSPSLSTSSSTCSLSSSFSLISIPHSNQPNENDQDSIKEEQQQVTLIVPPSTTTIEEQEEEEEAVVIISLPFSSNKKSKKDIKDMFSESYVANWHLQKISAWKVRYSNPESFYFHHVDPCEGQRHGKWNAVEHQLFMKRYNTWISNGWELKTSWGLFSKNIPHRSGIQCHNYFRRLIQQNDSQVVAWVKKDHKDKHFVAGVTPPPTELSSGWRFDEFKELETKVDQWILKYN
ncbi:hypothetical protein BDA99DRAFT_502026 [Phascolomyces articulosus]|uniref:Myb-like domain-containing protein n=1 Tax=Phascolomyces articulosus TaxID=60185 RepID=A0AAD5KGY2_9FUNG|nr:hypothetical protein BDA99DRAFT_502026 [Phascolomyces articulosus]